MTVTVPDDVEKMIAALIESGAYQSTDDVLRAAVKVLDQDANRRRKVDELRKSLQESTEQFARGQVHDGEEVFAEVLRDLGDDEVEAA
jgi:putative addiction module CopG family antidote